MSCKSRAIRVFVAAAAPVLFCGVRCALATTATSISSFEGIDYPQVIYDPTTQTFSANPHESQNLIDEGGGEFRFTLNYDPPTYWDGNLDETSGMDSTDRQRMEVEGLGAYQDLSQTFEYSFKFETDPNFVGTGGFCHIFQLKGLDSSGSDPGDDPMVTLSLGSGDHGSLELYSPDGQGDSITIARTFNYAPNTWESANIIITTSTGTQDDGSVMASINGDAMQGVSDVPVYIDGLPEYRPKWGFYRAIDPGVDNWYVGANYIQDEDITAVQLVPEPASAALFFVILIPVLLRRRALFGV
jgi:hypothetical protein